MRKDVVKEYENLYAVMNRFRSYGASDTEPRAVASQCIRAKLDPSVAIVILPMTGDDWELFTSTMKCGNAARSLTAALKRLLAAIDDDTHANVTRWARYHGFDGGCW